MDRWARALRTRDACCVGADNASCCFLSVACAELLLLIHWVLPRPQAYAAGVVISQMWALMLRGAF